MSISVMMMTEMDIDIETSILRTPNAADSPRRLHQIRCSIPWISPHVKLVKITGVRGKFSLSFYRVELCFIPI